MPTSRKPSKESKVFTKTRDFIRKFVVLDDDQLNVCAVWVIGTWTFSPAAPAMPYTYPYLYINGPSGSGKSTLGEQVFRSICRQPEAFAGATGASMFRLMGDYDEETGQIVPNHATLLVDEIDATYNGAKDESNRQVFNIGYRQGMTVPRSGPGGKGSMRFPVFGPKALMGIDNGHLPDTVLNRALRITMTMASAEEAAELTPFFPWNVDEEAAELQEEMAQWAKEHAQVLREYEPKQGKLRNRQWEISRSLVQLAHALGVEREVHSSIQSLFERAQSLEPMKVRMYRAVFELFEKTGCDKHASRTIHAAVTDAGVNIENMLLMSYRFKEDGLPESSYLAINDPNHPDFIPSGRPKPPGKTQKGYWRHHFDDAFARYLADEDGIIG